MSVHVPEPRFAIGSKVFRASTDQRREKLPCPDCLGSETWKVTTPSGSTYEATCVRCSPYGGDLPRPSHEVFTPRVQELTIGKISINASSDGNSYINYMCEETGVGSGSVYSEDEFLVDREAAMARAEIMAKIRKADSDAKPVQQRILKLNLLTLKDANQEETRRAYFNLRSIISSVREIVETAEKEYVDSPVTALLLDLLDSSLCREGVNIG